LQDVPQFIVFSDPAGFEGESSTIQCKVLQHNHLGGGPVDEESVPNHVNLNFGLQPPFDFFGLGHPGPGPVADEPQQDQQEAQHEGHWVPGLRNF